MERLTRRHADGELFRPVYVIDGRKGYVNETDIIDKLAEYEDLEEQNRLLKLPCAVGDTVYHLCTLKSGETEMIEMKVGCVEPYGAIRNHKGVCEIWNVYAETDCTKAYFRFSDFNKTVFLTREEAEAALKEL